MYLLKKIDSEYGTIITRKGLIFKHCDQFGLGEYVYMGLYMDMYIGVRGLLKFHVHDMEF